MSLYDTVVAEFQPAPPYASRSNFTSYFGYAAGQNLGKFPSISEAKAAGAATTEKVVDEDGFKVAQNAYQEWSAKVGNEYNARVRAEHPEVSQAVFDIVYGAAYEDAHAYGHGDYVDLAKRIIAASNS